MLKPAVLKNDTNIFADTMETRLFPSLFLPDSPLAPLNDFPFSKASLKELTSKLELLAYATVTLMKKTEGGASQFTQDDLILFTVIQMLGFLLTEIKNLRIDLFCPDNEDLLDFKPDTRLLSTLVPPNGEQQKPN